MLLDELRETIKSIEPDISTIESYWKSSGFEEEYTRLHEQSQQEDFWKNPNQTEISRQLHAVEQKRDQYNAVVGAYKEFSELVELFSQDEQELAKLKNEIYKLNKTVTSFKVALLLNEADDDSSCFLSINAGAGGTESQDWADILLRMYTRFCERENRPAVLIDYQAGEEAGIKSATLFIRGKNAYGLLKGEQGIHRLVRISPFDSNKRRHTSFAAVTATPEAPEVEITIDPKDLRIDTYRSGGAGGQHVNKTESAIRITHIPTNTVVQCQNERSQAQNKETAMKMLKAKLVQRQKQEELAKAAAVEKKKIEWGSQIRSYVLHPYKMVKDHRTDFESQQPDLVLDGELMGFIESFLIWHGTQN